MLTPHATPCRRQQGIALFIVIVLVLLSMLLVLWASRSALFGELIVGNDADHQWAFEAAQALLQDAELDIRGEQADGSACQPDGTPEVCRQGRTGLPLEAREVGPLLATLDAQAPTRCRDALCAKRTGKQDLWNNTDAREGPTMAQMTASGAAARYGQYTGATSGRLSQPLLARRESGQGGWYWIEILPYDASAGNSGLIAGATQHLALQMTPQVVYRITAIAHGLKPGTQVVLQQTYARPRRRD